MTTTTCKTSTSAWQGKAKGEASPSFFVRARALDAARVQTQRVVFDLVALGLGNFFLARLDLGIKKLLDPATVHTHDVVVVMAFVEFKNRLAVFKVASAQDAGLLKLRQHAVHRGQADGDVVREQDFVNVFRAHVTLAGILKQRQDGLARPCHFETNLLEVVRFFVHGETGL